MKNAINQYETEEITIRRSLAILGYSEDYINNRLFILKSADPKNKPQRILVINEISKILKGIGVGYRPYYVHDLLSRITGLSPNYIQVISNTNNPEKILKNGNKN